MPRVPRSTPKKPGPYHAQPSAQPLLYKAPPQRAAPAGFTPPPPKAGPSAAKVARFRTPFFAVAGTFAFGIAFYATSLYKSSTRAPCSHPHHSPTTQKDVSSVYDDTASGFDAEVGLSEWLMGVTRARKQLAKQCKGDVLEVSAGTGRNLGYYKFTQDGVRSLTLVDLSKQMVDQAKQKWEILGGGKKIALGVPVRFMQGDAAARMPDPPVVEKATPGEKHVKIVENTAREGGKKGYDTIVQTMGLCSTPAPVDLLKNLIGHLNTENKDARILLLEHGRSYYQWLNRILDSQAPQHADQHGCWWNRDIGNIIEESGLEIVKEVRKDLGTTWIFELKPKKEDLKQKVEAKVEEIKETVEKTAAKAGWFSKWN